MAEPAEKSSPLLTKSKTPQVGAILSIIGFVIMLGGIYLSASAAGGYSGSSGCLNPASASSYVTTFTRGTGKISTTNGAALCSAVSLVLESYNVPSTWNGKGFNATALPETEYAAVNVSLPGGQTYAKQTVSVPVPPSCKNTQLDFYFPPAYPSIMVVGGDSARYIGGALFGGYGSCASPSPSPSPTPSHSPSPTPSHSPTPTPSHSPTPTPSNTPSPSPTPSHSPTPTPSGLVDCLNLGATVTSGSAPLAVTFTGAGTATGGTIVSWQFDFGDNSQVTTKSKTVDHTYVSPGMYTATLQIMSSTGTKTSVSAACSATINVGGVTPTPSVTPPPTGLVLPDTGIKSPLLTLIGAFLVTLGLIQIWLTQRKKLLVVPKKRR